MTKEGDKVKRKGGLMEREGGENEEKGKWKRTK